MVKSRGAGRPGGTINILLTSAGRRNYLVEYFREALRGRGRVFAADARAGAPALQEADGVVVMPPADDPHYVDALLEFCEAQRIGLLVPLSDLELPGLAAARARFAALGTTVLVSSPAVIGRCADKWATYDFLRLHGLRTPATYLNLADAQRALAEGRERFPLVLKPRWGSAALGLEFVYDDDGQLLTSSFLDYLIPTAMEVPEIKIGHHETPSPWTPHGIKGGGEGGRMMAPAAINVAVNDALAPLGIRLTELPLTPDRIRAALRAAGTQPRTPR